MTDERQKRIISKNLTRLLDDRNLSQIEVAEALKVPPQTMNSWVKGVTIPRMGKIQALADYFGVNKSDIIDEKLDTDKPEGYYYDPEVAKMVEELRTRPGMRILFDATRDLSMDDIEFVVKLVDKMKGGND